MPGPPSSHSLGSGEARCGVENVIASGNAGQDRAEKILESVTNTHHDQEITREEGAEKVPPEPTICKSESMYSCPRGVSVHKGDEMCAENVRERALGVKDIDKKNTAAWEPGS